MPTGELSDAIAFDEARAHIVDRCFRPTPGDLAVGLEIEFFAIEVDNRGRPLRRCRIAGADGLVSRLDAMVGTVPWLGARIERAGNPFYPVAGGGFLSFEPGAQLEYSGPPLPGPAAALIDSERIVTALRRALEPTNVVLASTGVDLWTNVASVPQQLHGARYPAMAAYLGRIGSAGATMMRHTASTQINLDLGDERSSRERWMLANLASPLLTASFAASPTQDGVSARTRAWQSLDVTRTGFPTGILHCDDSPGAYADAALAANVLLFWRADGTAAPGEPGFPFSRWIAEGHAEHGWPMIADLDYHLSTLFFEVRPRGFLELRSVEGLPDPWRAVPVVLMSALLYEPEARREALELLRPLATRLGGLWQTAAREGVRDNELRDLSVTAWEIGLAGAARLGAELIRPADIERTERFIERFTRVGRLPADEYAAAFAAGPACALRWAEDGESGLTSDHTVAGCLDGPA